MSFNIALSNVLLTLFYLLPGFLLAKIGRIKTDSLAGLSAVLIYINGPFLVINAFLQLDFSAENAINMILFFIVTLALQAAFMLILHTLFRRRSHEPRFRILTIGSVLGNVGFFGLPVVRALMPDHPEVMVYSTVFVLSMNLLTFTVGVFCLTGDPKYMTLHSAIFNPTMLGFLFALPLHILGGRHFLPQTLQSGISLMGAMSTPMCMFILGIRLTAIPAKKLFGRPFVYVICLTKLVIFPLFCFACTYFLPLPPAFKASVLVLSSVPSASIILNLAEIHHSETDLSANVLLVSTLMCFLTIPMLTMLVL